MSQMLSRLCAVCAWAVLTTSSLSWASDQALDAPVTITPADGAAGDNFGNSVSVSGDRMVIGAPFGDGVALNTGAAYVYVRSGNVWMLESKITAPDGAATDSFGTSVAISGDRIIVGAPNDDDAGLINSGSAYLFLRNCSDWFIEAKFTAQDGAATDLFGTGVAISGERIVVGAYGDDDLGLSSGSAYVFERAFGTGLWTQSAKLKASNGVSGDFFGYSVAIDGTQVAIGAYKKGDYKGSVYVYGNSGGIWSEQAIFNPPTATVNQYFGRSLSINGSRIAVGAYNGNGGQGAAYVFLKTGTLWAQETEVIAVGLSVGDQFGYSVALSGDRLVGGARADDDVASNSGAVYVFVRRGTLWSQESKLVDSAGSTSDLFGSSVSLDNDRVVVGAFWADPAGSDSGACHLYNFNNALNLDEPNAASSASLQSVATTALAHDRIQVRSHAFHVDPSLVFDVPVQLIGIGNLATATTGSIVCADGMSVQIDGGSFTVENQLTTDSPATLYVDAALNISSSGTVVLPATDIFCTGATDNNGSLVVDGDSTLYSALTNDGSTLVRKGELWVIGSLVNNGVLIGQGVVGNNPLPGDGIRVTGGAVIGSNASLLFSGNVWTVGIGGNFDCAINSSSRFSMDQATLRLTGSLGTPQSVEAMSQNVGASPAGFAVSNFGIGRLEIAAGASATLVDARANSGFALETMYVRTLVVPAGATFNTGGRTIFVQQQIVSGSVIGTVVVVVPPTISTVSPTSGSTLGNTAITITGTNLTGATTVTVGGVPATNVVVVNSTSVTANTPAGTAGVKAVAITTPGGTASLATGFTYVAPAIPGDVNGDGVVNGMDLAILLGAWGTSVPAADLNHDGVINGSDLAILLGAWGTTSPPAIATLTPWLGSTLGGTSITITGASFTGATSVTVGGAAATNVVVVSSTMITATTPAGSAGSRNVIVTAPGGIATMTDAFQYLIYPTWATVLEGAPSGVTDLTLRAAIIATNRPWRVRDNASNIEMLLVPNGTFMMGASADDTEASTDEIPQHQVSLTEGFYLGKTEVTQAVWLAEMGSNPSYFSGYSDSPSRPVERVSWDMAQTFCTQNSLRLPTEAEWEWACRAGTVTPRYGVLDDIAWHTTNSGGATHSVATKLPNALGFYDTLGNVWEWNQDWYGQYSSAGAINPTGPATGAYRVFRGGSWVNLINFCRASRRAADTPSTVYVELGLRVAKSFGAAFAESSKGPLGDIDGDGVINSVDMAIVLSNWGEVGSIADVNDDGVVNSVDLGIVLANWS